MSRENNKIQEYISSVCSLIKNKDVHYDISLELKDHIETLIEEYIHGGLSEDVAIEKAICHMGDPKITGKQLDKTHKAKVSWGVITPLIAISVFGFITMYFIQSNGSILQGSYTRILQKNIIFYALGIAFAIGLYFFDYRKLLPYSKLIYVISILALILQLFAGVFVNGRPYFSLGFLTIDFVPICSVLLLISLSGMFKDWNWKNPYKFLLALGIILVPELLILFTKSARVYVYILGCTTLMIISRAKIHEVVSYIGIHLICFWILISSEPYGVNSFSIFLDPSRDPNGAGWQYIQLKNLLSLSGILGNSQNIQPKTIPELHTNFIFTYIIYTFGWIAAFALILVIITLVLKMIKVAKVTKNSYGRLLLSGLISLIATEFILNIAMNLGFTPILGLGLPFISFGGSQMIMNMIIIGLILSVYKRKDIVHNNFGTSNCSKTV
ncbi:cell division protein FtsW (lipid II flippase) [Clostridium punense]|uniref:Cell division protein FtsW (Lipid II flippase) n=1 Tax=Clostridium punense TaxID=1054297 RepID=A0ABS4K2Q1_9CLOT|nr:MULTISPECIES: FtsW/RodA/SpoVE family cell cycle protein [Clostridium]EQB87649.1 hypothetical protein M918_08120 [Clostridium sp. BL8]MBP2022063.1 cell division protein FtsW (lipid II flippase) [Clostridium punense]